jgi:hypothetical protein
VREVPGVLAGSLCETCCSLIAKCSIVGGRCVCRVINDMGSFRLPSWTEVKPFCLLKGLSLCLLVLALPQQRHNRICAVALLHCHNRQRTQCQVKEHYENLLDTVRLTLLLPGVATLTPLAGVGVRWCVGHLTGATSPASAPAAAANYAMNIMTCAALHGRVLFRDLLCASSCDTELFH